MIMNEILESGNILLRRVDRALSFVDELDARRAGVSSSNHSQSLTVFLFLAIKVHNISS